MHKYAADYPILDTFTTTEDLLGQETEVAVTYEYSAPDLENGCAEWLDLFDVELRLWTQPHYLPDGSPADGRRAVATASIMDVLTDATRRDLTERAWQHLRDQRLAAEADADDWRDWPVAA